MPVFVGVDLGSSNSVVAIVDSDGQAAVLKNACGQPTTPSAVFIDGSDFAVGQVALNSLVTEPEKVVTFAKRRMGKNQPFMVDGARFSPEFISSVVLRKVIMDAEDALGERIDGAVITVPAYFGETERQATYSAARMAGINVLRLINEPTAAALAYGITHQDEPGFVLVYDLGGGTFDVTVLAIRENALDVVGLAGDPALGGADFDKVLYKLVKQMAQESAPGEILWDASQEAELQIKCEAAKRQLTGRQSVPVPMKLRVRLADGGEVNQPLRLEVTRAQFEKLCSPLLTRSAIVTEEALRKSGLQWDDIRHILCVGGASRMPMVRALIEKLAGRPPLLHDPDECVAKGAALQAAQFTDTAMVPRTNIGHVLPRALGVAALRDGRPVVDHIVVPLTPLPCAEVRHGYTTSVDFQNSVQVPIYEGESTDIDAYVRGPIGALHLEISPPRRKGQPNISVEFRCDENGLIMAVARDLDTGRESKTTVTLNGCLASEEFSHEAALLARARIS